MVEKMYVTSYTVFTFNIIFLYIGGSGNGWMGVDVFGWGCYLILDNRQEVCCFIISPSFTFPGRLQM